MRGISNFSNIKDFNQSKIHTTIIKHGCLSVCYQVKGQDVELTDCRRFWIFEGSRSLWNFLEVSGFNMSIKLWKVLEDPGFWKM
jgi:hypothetical protein